jgi:hypothetical protein
MNDFTRTVKKRVDFPVSWGKERSALTLLRGKVTESLILGTLPACSASERSLVQVEAGQVLTDDHTKSQDKKTMIKTTIISRIAKGSALAAFALALSSAQAGTSWSGKGVKNVIEPTLDPVGVDVTVGYDSAYYFRGLWFSDHNLWMDISTSIPLTESLSLDLMGYYTDTATSLNYSEMNLGTGLTYDAGFASFTLGYTYFYFFNQFYGDDVGQHYAHEVGLSTSIPVGMFNVNLGYYYDLFISAHYFEAGVDTTVEVTDRLSIVPSAVIGYGASGYYTSPTQDPNPAGILLGGPLGPQRGDGWNHILLNVAFPFQLAENAVLAPYVALNVSLKGRENLNVTENELFGGAALTVSF